MKVESEEAEEIREDIRAIEEEIERLKDEKWDLERDLARVEKEQNSVTAMESMRQWCEDRGLNVVPFVKRKKEDDADDEKPEPVSPMPSMREWAKSHGLELAE